MGTAAAPTRGFLLTLIGVIGIIQGILAVLGGIGLLAERNDAGLQRNVDVSDTTLAWTGAYLIIIGAITLVVAIGLLRGSNIARYVIAVIELFHIGGGLYVLIAQDGTERWDGLAAILVALLILWILFRARSEDFFESRTVL
ncbi:MAG TPA: hypothetical protein VHK23_03510 [Miltoncostaeaceae bacterium]|jgi:uncharacterized membrane protein (DUF2068 family)|nr:hypothetical protein [Miltoncostaeaceae bacterium]